VTARDIIRESEGLRLKAYPDPATGGRPYTIAFGHTKGVKLGDTCTPEQAEAWLTEDMADAYRVVASAVTVPLTEKQRDALCSFVFNVGPGVKGSKDGFVRLKSGSPSTMLRKLNADDYSGAAAEFPKWNKGAGKPMRGLTIRRGKERALFLSGTGVSAEPIPPLEEKPVAPFLIAAIPSLIAAIPEFAKIFTKPDVAARNVEAAMKAVDIVVQATGATNVQEAVEKVESEPEAVAAANTALRMSQADVMDLFERMVAMDEKSVGDARMFYQIDKPLLGNWRFAHILSLLLVFMGGGAACYVLVTSQDATERAMALQTLLVVGFASVASFWLGSSRGSQMKDAMRESNRDV
jgi:lysozyme